MPAPARAREKSRRRELGLTWPGVTEVEAAAMASPPADATASAISLQHPPAGPLLGSKPERASDANRGVRKLVGG